MVMTCIIYNAPFVLKKDVYAYEKSLASPKCHMYVHLKKSKAKTQKRLITKDAVIYVCHTESSSAVFKCKEPPGNHNHVPVMSVSVKECLRV